MEIIDLTENYIKSVCRMGAFEQYEKNFQFLFNHYYKFWHERKEYKIYQEREIITNRNLIMSELKNIENKFRDHELDLSKLRLILFVGQGTTNGHALYHEGIIYIWIPVETYSNQVDCTIFITHELIHGLHYQSAPSFYFQTKAEKNNAFRQLITEGIATYLTKNILPCSEGVSLWGNYLSEEEIVLWLQNCKDSISDLKTFIRSKIKSPDELQYLFYAADKRNIFKYRAGYYLGLEFIKEIVMLKKYSNQEILCIPKLEFSPLLYGYLDI